MTNSQKTFAQLYDIFSSSKNYKKETKFLKKFIKKNFKHKITMLDIGCGTASHIKLLKNKNIKITGIDLNPYMIKIAKNKVKGVRFKTANMKTFKLKKQFHLITALFNVFGYNLTKNDLKKTIKNAYNHLNKEGYLIFDIGFTKDRYKGKSTPTQIDKFKKHNLTRIYNSEKHGNIIHFNYTIMTNKDCIRGTHKTGFFKISEIKKILKQTGFETKVLDGKTFRKFNKRSYLPLFINQKR